MQSIWTLFNILHLIVDKNNNGEWQTLLFLIKHSKHRAQSLFIIKSISMCRLKLYMSRKQFLFRDWCGWWLESWKISCHITYNVENTVASGMFFFHCVRSTISFDWRLSLMQVTSASCKTHETLADTRSNIPTKVSSRLVC